MLKAAFQGVRGAYSEEAVIQLLGDDVEFCPMHSFEDIFRAVSDGTVDKGVIPVENSLTGSIHQNYDLFLENDLHITGETIVRIRHNLIVNPGTTRDNVKRVLSHPQGLMQCDKYLEKFGSIAKVPEYDTAGSVRMIKEEKMLDAGAIGSKRAAEFYGMEIMEEGVEDVEENYTRFLVIESSDEILESADKTSLLFSLQDGPGILFKCLSVFALRDIDLVRIESRPVHGRPWQYFFYLDIAMNMKEERAQNAVNHLQEITIMYKFLGCFKGAEAS